MSAQGVAHERMLRAGRGGYAQGLRSEGGAPRRRRWTASRFSPQPAMGGLIERGPPSSPEASVACPKRDH